MNVFFYAGEKGEARNKLETLAENMVSTDLFCSAENLAQMVEMLHSEVHRHDIVILLIADEAELDYFLKSKELFEDVRLILILSTNDANQVARAHLLRPRFVDIAPDQDFSRVGAVLTKMLTHPA